MVLLFVCGVSVPAVAQVTTSPIPGETYLPVLEFVSPLSGFCFPNVLSVGTGGWCNVVSPTNSNIPAGVPVSLYATKDDVNAAIAPLATRDYVNGLVAPLATKSEVDSMINKSFQFAAISAALKDAVPNAGDRFAIRLNAGGFSGNLAGAIGLSANVNRATRILFNYGRSKSESAMSGGLNFSFH
jgi:hypothetical protein